MKIAILYFFFMGSPRYDSFENSFSVNRMLYVAKRKGPSFLLSPIVFVIKLSVHSLIEWYTLAMYIGKLVL